MFIRKTSKKDPETGKKYFSYQLVEAYRTERGPRQRILLNLGSDLNLSDLDRNKLSNRIEEILNGTNSFETFACEEYIEKLAQTFAKQIIVTEKQEINEELDKPDYQSVDLNSLEHEQARSVGVEYLALETLNRLGIPDKLKELGMTQRQIEVAIGVIVGRLVCLSSECATYNWLQSQSGMGELISTDFDKLSLNTLYEVGDQLLMRKDALEQHLEITEQNIFDLDNTIVLYDLTNTYFEGTAEAVPHAAKGRSKEKRTDCSLVTLGLVLGTHGFPIQSKILPGNVSEPSSLHDAIKNLSICGDGKPTVVLDAGIATEKNLTYLRDNNYSYIVASRSRSCESPDGIDLVKVKETDTNTVHAAKLELSENGETCLYCHSTARQEKEGSMRALLQERFEEGLKGALSALTKKSGTKSYDKVLERIGRLKEKHKKIASYYEVKVIPDAEKKQAIDITWKIRAEKADNRFQGSYLLRTYGLDWNESELWNTYIMLTEVEEAFRCLKSNLGLRPVFHQIGERVDAHLFVTLLAYHVMQTINYTLKRSGISMRWETIQRSMSSLIRVSTTMKLESGKTAHIRSSTNPEPIHRKILKSLGLPLRVGKKIKTLI
jgi:transposase